MTTTAKKPLADWFGNEARRVYGRRGEATENRELRELAEWIASRHDGAATPRQLVQGRWAIKTTADAEAMLDRLAAAGYGAWRVAATATNQRREFAVTTASTSTDSPEAGEIVESVDVDGGGSPKITTNAGDGWEVA